MSEKEKEHRPRRKFTREFKADVVKLCRSKPIAEVARRLDLTDTGVRTRVKQAEVDEGRGSWSALTTDEKAELAQLRRENKRLTMKRDILKKATAFFAKEWS